MNNIANPGAKVLKKHKQLSQEERRKWDAILTVLLFVFALAAAVLFNLLTHSEPLIANSGY